MDVNRMSTAIGIVDYYFDDFVVIQYHGVGIHAVSLVVQGCVPAGQSCEKSRHFLRKPCDVVKASPVVVKRGMTGRGVFSDLFCPSWEKKSISMTNCCVGFWSNGCLS